MSRVRKVEAMVGRASNGMAGAAMPLDTARLQVVYLVAEELDRGRAAAGAWCCPWPRCGKASYMRQGREIRRSHRLGLDGARRLLGQGHADKF